MRGGDDRRIGDGDDGAADVGGGGRHRIYHRHGSGQRPERELGGKGASRWVLTRGEDDEGGGDVDVDGDGLPVRLGRGGRLGGRGRLSGGEGDGNLGGEGQRRRLPTANGKRVRSDQDERGRKKHH